MNNFRKIKEKGIPLRSVHILMVVLTAVVAFFMLLETSRFSAAFEDVTGATDDYIELQKDANELMSASDYLTQEVQNFTVTGEEIHMIHYFEESTEAKHRENSLNKMKEIMGENDAYEYMNKAMSESVGLMQSEYYAMKLVVQAKEIEHIPDEVKNIELKSEHAAMSSDEKMKTAQMLVHDTTYYQAKDRIRTNMQRCLNELEKQTHAAQNKADEKLENRLNNIRVVIFVQLGAIILILSMTTLLIIMPMMRGVHNIKKDEMMPVEGAYEFRYLAITYNKMYDAFKKSIASLNYDASHDKLTGLYNRAGYDILSKSIDLKTTAVMLIDADKFKEINDTYGHAVGDKILQKVAATLKKTFRSEDYICRIGGDEFIVFMKHVSEELQDLIILKSKQINEALTDTSDGLPPVSMSIGVAFGTNEQSTQTMIKHADEALYNVKKRGRCGCSFYKAYT